MLSRKLGKNIEQKKIVYYILRLEECIYHTKYTNVFIN